MKLLLFDLGGVIIHNNCFNSIIELLKGKISENEVREIWINSNSVHLFESGKIDKITFAQGVISDFNLSISIPEFLDLFYTWPAYYFDGAVDLLQELRGSFKIGCLTNCNSIHWDRLLKEFKIDNYFEYPEFKHKVRQT